MFDIQKAGLLKRVSAWILDLILLVILSAGFAWIISDVVGYDAKSTQLEAYYTQYETEYNTSFTYTPEEYEAMTEEQKANYDAAYKALLEDQNVIDLYNMVIRLTIVILSIGILLSTLVLEFAIPLWLRNGQTVGKKIFGLAVMRTNSVRVNGVCMFIRSILGKYTIETMIPVLIVTMWMLNLAGMGMTVVLVGLLLAQLVVVIVTSNNALIHDLLADTVVVDLASQMIFQSEEDRLAYQQREAAEKAERQFY